MNQPMAYIHPNARIAEDVKIEPFAWIGEVRLYICQKPDFLLSVQS